MPERNRGLDLIRGMAIALVLLRHALPAPFPGGGVVGVVMFFALSGFLITGVLLDEHTATDTINLGRFYFRRAVRLVPALVLMLLLIVVVTVVFDPLHDRGELPATLLWALTWTGDLPFGHASAATFHLWTLALEEQFYLVWPAVLLWGLRRHRVPVVLALVGGLCALGTLGTVIWLHAAPDAAYSLPTAWAGCFVVGAATRIFATRLPTPGRTAIVAAVGFLGVLALIPLRGHAWTYLIGGPAIALATAVLLLGTRRPTTAFAPLAALGLISYGVYLLDYPLTLWMRTTLPTNLAGIVAAAIAIPLAWLMYHRVEAPLSRAVRARSRVEAFR